MNFSRRFQAVAMVISVAALAWIAYESYGHVEINNEDRAPTLAPAQPEAASPSLPRSAAEILAELRRRGYTLQSVDAPPPSKGATGYRAEGLPAAVVFHEREGRLAAVNVALLKTGPSTNAAAALDFAEIVGEVATGRSRDTMRQAIGQTMSAVGKSAGRMSCSFGENGEGFRLETVRHDDGGYSFVFAAE